MRGRQRDIDPRMTDFFIDDWDNGAVAGTLPADVTPYLDLVPSEHRNRPNFITMLTDLLQPLGDLQINVGLMPSLFDIDTAAGDQLDKVGEWVGVGRDVQVALTGVYFSLDSATLGLDQGSMQGPDDPTSGLVVLPDSGYRTLLRARIAANHWDGSIPGAYAAWDLAFSGTGFSIGIVDLNNMHFLYVLFGGVPDALTIALFTGGFLDLRPAGVAIDLYITEPAANVPFFGLDSASSTVAGLDVGYFGNEFSP